MIKRFREVINLVRADAYLRRQEEAHWGLVSKGENTFLERPVFKIEGAEFITIGRDSSIGRDAWLGCYNQFAAQRFSPRLEIGNNVRIGNHVCITVIDHVSIGNGCLFSDYVYISDHLHDFAPTNSEPLVDHPLKRGGKVVVGTNVFVGIRAAIMPGVSVGDYSVVGAGAVVTKSFPAYSMVAGAPAKLIKSFSVETNEWIDVRVV